MKKQVYIAYTGGTIGMSKTPDGYAPAPGYLKTQMSLMPELRDAAMPDYTLHKYDVLLDSSNMMPDDWFRIARDIADNYEKYDGFIVLHGTDTMAYTASVLPFMLRGLGKPVIITGSQIPLCEIRNDARENLITGLIIAANSKIPEVCLYFGNKLLRGCRSVKVSADGFDAFASPNFPALGVAGVGIDINRDLILPPPPETVPLTVQQFNEPTVGTLRLFPGISSLVVSNMLQPPLRGLVLGTYGVGNGPDQDRHLIAVLKEATDRGVVIVNCTQCLEGSVSMGDYVAGSVLARAGVISGFDMTIEAALAKLFYLFSTGYSSEEVKKEMQKSLCGELTLPI